MCPALSQVVCPGPALCLHSPACSGSSRQDSAAWLSPCEPGQKRCGSSLDTYNYYIFHSVIWWLDGSAGEWLEELEALVPQGLLSLPHLVPSLPQDKELGPAAAQCLWELTSLSGCFSVGVTAGGPQAAGGWRTPIPAERGMQGGLSPQGCGHRRVPTQHPSPCMSP